jgi:hypothetical protein
MDPVVSAKILAENGAGVGALLAIAYIGYRVIAFMDRLGSMAVKFMENHMAHLQQGMEKLVDNSTEANAMLREHGRSLDAQSRLLTEIATAPKSHSTKKP